MKHTKTIRIFGPAVVAAITFILSIGGAVADTVKLKDGTTIEGVITFEASDMLKIRVQRPGSTISETKTILKSDMAEMTKSAPDDVDFAKLKTLLPTPSLMNTSQYQSMIDKGPQAFLNSYTDSKHRPEVEKIKKELDDELAKVNLGYFKIKGEWISPKSRRDYKEAIDARIQTLSLEQQAQRGDFVSALRGWERMEENYFGTPSYVESVKIVQQFLPAFGQQLQRMVADVEFLKKQFEEDLAKMPESKRGPVVAARQQEEDRLKQRFEADKGAGVKWHQYNKRDKEDLTAYIGMVSAEIEKVKAMDLIALEEQSKQLVKVDELLAEGKLGPAKDLLRESTGLVSGKSKGGSKKKSTSPYGSSGKGGSRTNRASKTVEKSSYPKVLQEKIAMKEKAIADKIAQDKNTAEGEKARDAIRGSAFAAPILDTETVDGQEGSKRSGDITKLIDNTPAPEKKEPAATKKPTPKKKPVKKSVDEDEDEGRKPVSSGGYRFRFQHALYGIVALMAITIGLMKLLGIGGAKE